MADQGKSISYRSVKWHGRWNIWIHGETQDLLIRSLNTVIAGSV